ncbi:46 kDa FK506-binding nuclear protein isoform X2 [Aplysia californica]|uniref:FK506-binding protein n=1 Tax=Aplysia californica TaxID=6500 RepID=A0ABM0ZUP8_APLCA|nr:46 kDa FK506-binding nuclear protein isoform X2 [Aplysia californica]
MVVIRDMANMFWGVTIDAGKRYSQTVTQGFCLSMAALENKSGSNNEFVQVLLQHESSEYLLCTLQHGKLLQQPLNLNFAAGEQVSFSLNGSGIVHLTGFVVPEYEGEMDDESFSGSDEDIPDLVPAGSLQGKRKAESPSKASKKLKLLTYDGGADGSDDEDDDDYVEGEEEEEEDFSDDFDDSFFDEDDSEEDDEDEEEDMGSAKKGKKAIETPQSAKQKAQLQKKTPQQTEKTPNASPKKTPKQNAKTPEPTETPSTPANGEDTSAKKKKKKKKKKNNEGDTSGNNSSMNESKSETPSSSSGQNSPKKRVVSGGTLVEDLKAGHGPEAKPGKMVSVYYVGTLAKNNKRFDSCTGGKPFRFRLNQGEVIKGWDKGVNGMKVGGKRRITVPASQGYGNMKQGPIPANSTLVFEVELKAVS